MAGTPVRRAQRSFAAAGIMPTRLRSRIGALAERRIDADMILLAIVVVQLLASGLLIARNALDLSVAACISSALLAAAALYASRRTGTPAASDTITQGGEAVAAVSAQIEQVRASEAWIDLMARISHEIRTPLNAVIGFSDLMEREIFGPLGHERYGDYAAHIKDSGEALLKSAEDTLALSSLLAAPQSGERPNIFGLGDIVLDAWRPLEAQATRRGVSLRLVDGGRVDVLGERRVCRQAILNLLTEALNRAGHNDEITVSVLGHSDAVRLAIETTTAAQWRHESTPSLAVCLARTLLERVGSRLTVSEDRAKRTWSAATTLERPLQDDFFAREG